MESIRISDSAELIAEGTREDGHRVFAEYHLFGGKWLVVAEGETEGQWEGLSVLSIQPADWPDFDGEQISTEVMRAVPLRDARDRIKRLRIEARKVEGLIPDLPSNFKTPHDFAMLAAAYVEVISSGNLQPIKHLSRQYGISRNTVSARIRRAREDDMALLTKPNDDSLGELTPKAIALLKSGE